MFIDVVFIIILLFAFFKGLRNGLIVGLFSFLAIFIGLAAALKLSTFVAAYLGTQTTLSERWLPFLAFTIVFIGVVLLVRLGAKAIEGMVRIVMLGWLNRIGGIFFYSMLYSFIFSILLFYLSRLSFLKPEATEASVVYPFLQPLGPKMIAALGYIIPIFKNMFHDLEGFFSGTSKKP
ncbi:MAG TPA: CvpA family protein [Chitinophagaceae bacterium]|nr:CvpA family protein [Chitinophagaceae bacterium]